MKKLFYLSLAGVVLASSGCYRRVTYASPQGRRVEIVNLGFDTRVASLEAETSDGRLRIERVDSRAQSARRLLELLADVATDSPTR